MKSLKRSLIFILILSITCSTLGPIGIRRVHAADEDWKYDENTKTLYVYNDIICTPTEESAPWDVKGYTINHVVVEETVNKLEYAFYGDALYSITIKNKNIDIGKAFYYTLCNTIIVPEDISLQYGWTDNIANVTLPSDKEFATYFPKMEDDNNGLRPYVLTNIGSNHTKNDAGYGLDISRIEDYSFWNIWDTNTNNEVSIIPSSSKVDAIALAHSFYGKNDASENDALNTIVYYDMKINQTVPTEAEVGTKVTFNDYSFSVYSVGDYSMDAGYEYASSYWNESVQDWVPLFDTSKSDNERNEEEYLLASFSDLEKYETSNGAIYISPSDITDTLTAQGNYFLNKNDEKCFIGKTVVNEDYSENYYYSYNNVDWIEIEDFTYWEDYENTTLTNDNGEIFPIYCIDEYAKNSNNNYAFYTKYYKI